MLATSSVSVINVNDGATIVENIVEYCVYTSGDVVPGSPLTDSEGNIIYDANGLVLTDGAWSTTMPQSKEGDFIWTRSKTVYSDGTFALAYMVSHHGENGERGATGVSVTNVVPEYRLSNSSTALTGTGTGYTWSTKKPSVQSDQYIWERQRNELSDGSVVYSEAVCDVVMSGVVFDVNQNKNAITSKVWETDISTKINEYDGSAMSTVRDRVTKTENDIDGINTTVTGMQTTISTKADGSTVTELQRDYSDFKQTMGGFKTTVESSYATKADLDDIKVGGANLYVIANQVPGFLHQSNGSISAQNATGKEYTSAYIPVKEGESIIIQSWCTPLNESGAANPGYSWLAYQFFSDDDPVTPIGNRSAKWGYSSGSGVETTADGKEHLMYKVTAPANANYIRISYRRYEDGYAMVEKATNPSEYVISTADLESNSDAKLEEVRTVAEQTADKFSWIVEDGSSASSVTYTSNAVNAMAEQINLSGKVTFSAFDTDTQNALTSETELIVGTQTASTSAWTGKSTKLKSIAAGTRIAYKLPYASTSTAVTLNLTLSNNTTTGAIAVYYLNTTRLSTQYGVNSIIQLIYDGTDWRVLNPYSDANTYDRVRYQQVIKAGATAIVAGNLIVAGANNVGTYTHLKLGNAFDTTYPILYAAGAISANGTGNNNYIVFPMILTTTQSGTYTAYKAVYIKGTLSGTTFTPVSTTPLTQTIPTSADGYHYILLGTTYDTTHMYLLGEHPIYMYYDGGFKTVAQIAAEAATTANTANTTANTANGTANTALNGLKAFTGTSSTATGTAAKVVTCSDSTFALTNGTTITVTFSTANTADSPTLNVNSLGAKAIYFDNAVASSSNRFRWQAGSVITFQYNGTYWTVLNYENLEYFTSSTAAGTAAKTNANVTGTFVLCRGTTINVYFSTANSANAPTLNIGATGAYAIYYKNAVTSASNQYFWDAGTTLTFTYNGSYWYVNDGGSLNVKNYAKTAVDWVSTNGSSVITAKNILDSWKGEAEAGVTTINGGLIQTHTITANNLATDAIMSSNYAANTSSVYSTTGTFLDLSNGNITSPTFAVDNTNGTAYIDGTISAKNLLVGTAAAELSASAGTLNSSQGTLVGNALDATGDYIIYDGESIYIKTSNFSIDPAGNVTMTGEVNAASGSIGGWTISPKNLHYGSSAGSEGSVYLIPEGSMSYHTVGGSPEMSGWVITAGDSFGVTNNGSLYANDANITGTVTITDGGIGGMTIDSDTISTTTSGMSSNTSKYAFWAGETNKSYGTTSTDAKFKVGHNGKLTATNADITGKITASDGTIGGWKITSDSLYYYTNDTVPQVGTANSVFLCPEGSSTSKSIGGSPTTTGWVFTAGTGFGVTRTGAVYASSGRIGGVTLSDCNIYAYNTTTTPSFQLLSTGSLAIGGTSGITVDTNGVLSIPAARITGKLTAGQIEAGALTITQLAGFDIDDNMLRTAGIDPSSIDENSITLSTTDFSRTANNRTYAGLRFAIGSNFFVSKSGALYCTSGRIGGFSMGATHLYALDSNYATYTYLEGIGTDGSVYLGATNLIPDGTSTSSYSAVAGYKTTTWRLTIGKYFGVTGHGDLYCNSGKIGGLTISSDRLYNGSVGADGSVFIGASNLGTSATVASYTTSYWRLTVGQYFGITGSTVYGSKIRIINPTTTREDFSVDDNDYSFTVQNTSTSSSGAAQSTVKIGAAYEAGMTIQNKSGYKGSFVATNGNNIGIVHWASSTSTVWAFRYDYPTQKVYIKGTEYTSSDERVKTIHKHLGGDHKKLFMALKPIEYSFIDKPDERHFGLGAQTTKSSMAEFGFGSEYSIVSHSSYNEQDQYGMNESYYLNYIEALMLSVPVVQDHEKEIAKLKTRIEELENKLSQLTQ